MLYSASKIGIRELKRSLLLCPYSMMGYKAFSFPRAFLILKCHWDPFFAFHCDPSSMPAPLGAIPRSCQNDDTSRTVPSKHSICSPLCSANCQGTTEKLQFVPVYNTHQKSISTSPRFWSFGGAILTIRPLTETRPWASSSMASG